MLPVITTCIGLHDIKWKMEQHFYIWKLKKVFGEKKSLGNKNFTLREITFLIPTLLRESIGRRSNNNESAISEKYYEKVRTENRNRIFIEDKQ